MSRRFVCRVVVCAVVVAWGTAVWGIPLSVQQANNFFGIDSNAGFWNLVPSVTVSIQPGSYGILSIQGQIVCPQADLSGNKCTSNNYFMMYKVQNAPLNTTLNFTNLPGFNFATVDSSKLGIMQCRSDTLLLICGDNGGQTGTINATGSGANLSINLPTGANQPVAFYIRIVTAGNPTLPPVQVQVNPTPIQAHKYILPHIPSGAGYVTKITASNMSNTTASGDIIFVDQAGNLTLDVPFSIPTGGTFRTATAESDRFKPLAVSWAFIGSDQPIGVNLFFEFIAAPGAPHAIVNTVGFNVQRTDTIQPRVNYTESDFTIPIELEPKPNDAPIGRTVGVALANPTANAVTVKVKINNTAGSTVVQTGIAGCPADISIPAFGQTAFDTNAFFGSCPGFPPPPNVGNSFVGSMTVAATSTGVATPIAAVALEDSYGPFSATPVMPGRAPGK